MRDVKKLFIANRGEIALRILRTAKRLGLEVSVPYVPSESRGLVRAQADRTFLVPPGGYLDEELMLRTARLAGADAIHPGYGFLSERASFAERIEQEGLIFIGPTPDSMRALGEKSLCRQIATELEIPVAAGYDGDNQTEEFLVAEGNRIGFPLLVKATAGGGGRGMRLVRSGEELITAISAARREALGAFGDGRLLLEKFFEGGRHVEVQVIGDGTGFCFHLLERDCTVQRRYQKLLEEAPAFGISESIIVQLRTAAVRIAERVKLRGVSTVEFLVAGESFIFLEVNTRLQVEHPVTEEILGIDLVELQIRIARGESLEGLIPEIAPLGHAIEARIVAEDPYSDFTPSTGVIRALTIPEGLRVEHALYLGASVSGEFDSLLAKVIAFGKTREESIESLVQGLREFSCVGIQTNLPFLTALLAEKDFRAGNVSSELVPQALHSLPERVGTLNLAREAALHYFLGSYNLESALRRIPLNKEEQYRVNVRGEVIVVKVQLLHCDREEATFQVDDLELVVFFNEILCLPILGDEILVEGEVCKVTRVFPKPETKGDSHLGRVDVLAPLAGRVLKVMVSEGESVVESDAVILIESMKMEHKVLAPISGIVAEILVAEGSSISGQETLLVIKS